MTRFAAAALSALLATAPAHALELDNMSEADRAAFGAQVRAYLMENPQVIMEAVAVLEQREQAAQAQNDVSLVQVNSADLFDDGFSWVGGNPDGDITLVEFIDYRCGYCRRAHDEVAQLLSADGNIRLIVKELPILGDASVVSSRFAIAAKQVAGDDAYKQVHDTMIALSGEPNAVTLRRIAEGLDLDADAILERMDTDDVTAEIAATRALAQRLQINGTPTFVLQDELLRGYLPADQMAALVAQKRSAAN